MSAATTPTAARAGANPRAAGANASNPRRVAFDVLRQVTGEDAYANLALAKRLAVSGLDARDAGLVTELVSGTCRLMGTYDRVIEEASGRALGSLQPAVVDLLRFLPWRKAAAAAGAANQSRLTTHAELRSSYDRGVAEFLESFKEFPPSQKSASFNLEGVMKKMEEAAAGGV